jgi:hypothetical protein
MRGNACEVKVRNRLSCVGALHGSPYVVGCTVCLLHQNERAHKQKRGLLEAPENIY